VEATTYYDASTYKRHAKKPTYPMDLGIGKKAAESLEKKASYQQVAEPLKPGERDLTYTIDSFGNVWSVQKNLLQ